MIIYNTFYSSINNNDWKQINKNLTFLTAARSRSALHPEEREEADVRARMALVEIVRESRALVERSSDRGSAEGTNGEKKTVIYMYYMCVFLTVYLSAAIIVF